MDFITRCWDGTSSMISVHILLCCRLVLGNSELKGVGDGIVIVFPTKRERQSSMLQENTIIILPVLVQRGSLIMRLEAFVADVKWLLLGMIHLLSIRFLLPKSSCWSLYFPLTKLSWTSRGEQGLHCASLDRNPRREKSDLFLDVAKASIFYLFFFFNSCEMDKES